MDTSKMFTLNLGDIGRGLLVAVLTGLVFFSIPFLLVAAAPGFDAFQVNWHAVFMNAINSGISAFAGYIIKNLLTNSQGKFLGVVG